MCRIVRFPKVVCFWLWGKRGGVRGGDHVFTQNAPAWACALYYGQVNSPLGRQPARDWRYPNADRRCRKRYRRLRRILALHRHRLLFFRIIRLRCHLRFDRIHSRAVLHSRVFPGRANHGDYLPNRNRSPLLHEQLEKDSLGCGFELHNGLVRLDLGYRIAQGHLVPHRLEPAH